MSDVMNVLGTAIVDKIDSDTTGLKAALTGGFHYERASKGSVPPYMTYTMIAGPRLSTYTSEIENVDVTFFIYSNKQSPAECFDLAALLTAIFDDIVLTVTGFKMVRSDRQSSQPQRNIDDEGYFISVTYSIML